MLLHSTFIYIDISSSTNNTWLNCTHAPAFRHMHLRMVATSFTLVLLTTTKIASTLNTMLTLLNTIRSIWGNSQIANIKIRKLCTNIISTFKNFQIRERVLHTCSCTRPCFHNNMHTLLNIIHNREPQPLLTNKHVHSPQIPIHNRLHILEKLHTQYKWYLSLQNLKLTYISERTKLNAQIDLSTSFQYTTISKFYSLSNCQIMINSK